MHGCFCFLNLLIFGKFSAYKLAVIFMKKLICVFASVLLLAVFIMPLFGGQTQKSSYIKYVEFNVNRDALRSSISADIESKDEDIHINYIECLAYLGAKYGGNFSKYKNSDLSDFISRVKDGESVDEITKDMQYYSYYHEAYSAAVGGMVGEFEEENSDGKMEQKYGIKWYSPIAKTFPYSCYDDFGAVRTYGYTRPHLGHDLMAAVGTPVIAVESGTVEVLGWNQYGGWRIGIRSNDSKRYWYYAHLRQNRPFAEGLKEGDTVQAGDVIGYVGRTGYSTTENINNIDEYHLHLGLELIFDESQKESDNEIWIDISALTSILEAHQSTVVRNNETKEFTRQYKYKES